MEFGEERKLTPLKRTFEDFSSSNLENGAMETDTSFIPTEYELKVFEAAMRRNTISVLETSGVGNTVIAVTLIKEIGNSLKTDSGSKKLIIFLAPTVQRVHQRYKEVKSHVELLVGEYYGARGVDDWSAETWEKEINEHDVLVMTPQIFLDALRNTYIGFELVSLILLDECHVAIGNHPYARLMKDFYHKSTRRPKIFGMSASPPNGKGDPSIKDSQGRIRELEDLLDSKVYGVEENAQLETCVSSTKLICRFYDRLQSLNLELKAKLESSWSEFELLLLGSQRSLSGQYKEADDKYILLQDMLTNDFEDIRFCLENLGLICAHEAIKVCIQNVPKCQEECGVYKESLTQYGNFLQKVLSIIEEPLESRKLLDVVNAGPDAVTTGQISSKLHGLLEIFRSFGMEKEVFCVVFVERMIAAHVTERMMNKFTDFLHFNVSYLTGSSSSFDGLTQNPRMKVSESNFDGKVNILFCTDVVEEGILVDKCSSVIHFSLPKIDHSYAQSRKLIRPKDSQFIFMVERGNCKQIDHVSYLTKSEKSMIHIATEKEPIDRSLKASISEEAAAYVVESTGAAVDASSSISLIHRYCQSNKFQKPKFEPLMEGSAFRCKLILPPNAAFETIVGSEANNFNVSKQLVCLEACKKLHAMGALNDNLVPLKSESQQSDPTSNVKPTSSAGTTKRRELHGSVSIHQLAGTWDDKLDEVNFHVYKMKFSCNIAGQKYSSFVLLLETKLDEDVGNIEVDLYLLTKFVKASFSSHGQICLDAEQVAKAKCFQELIFNGLFGKLFTKSSGIRKFLLQTEESLWDPSNMYLLLPLASPDVTSEGVLNINWMGIQSCVSAVKYLKENAWLNSRQPELLGSSSSGQVSGSVTDINCDIIHLANKTAPVDSIKEMVVVAIHTGKIYSVLRLVVDTSAESPFEGDGSKFSSYADYYCKKYGIVLKYPEQPLFLLKQSHNSHNLLVDFRDEGASFKIKSESGRKNHMVKPQQHAHMPPELLVGMDVRADVLKSVYLLPSLMHRLESLMLASKLRQEISNYTGCYSHISSSLILEALTTQTCNGSFSMERLELLGDSVLKYSVSCCLFLKYPKKHEGQLSNDRRSIVSNAALHKFGTARKLQGYIRDCAFDPRRWTAAGQRSIWPCPCSHGLDSREVPLDDKFFSEDIKLMLGKPCDRGHRWMVSKTMSDCVEALIGAYYVGGGLTAAWSIMRWLGIEVETNLSLVEDAIKVASLHSYTPKAEDLSILESKLGYEFRIKGLLLEAITHKTEGVQVDYCYERLEFLGDAVLDILITWYLYENHRNLDPGELTDLRSASVSNDNFAIAAVKRNLHPHLHHCSLNLDNQISEFVKYVSDMTAAVLTPDTKAPKELGDLVESITGAVLIDSKLNLDEVWKVFEPVLSPIVTPDKLELPPSRELIELCDSLGYFIKEKITKKGDIMHADLKLQLENVLLDGQGSAPTRKAAKGMASLQILKKLESRGISSSSKLKKHDKDAVDGMDICSQMLVEHSASVPEKCKPHESRPEIKHDPISHELSNQICDSSNPKIPVLPPINMKKGGPRNSLYDLCKRQQWPMPAFQTTEQKSRTPIEFDNNTKGFNSYESEISLIIPDVGKIQVCGAARADKKSSFDSAAIALLHELGRQGKIRCLQPVSH